MKVRPLRLVLAHSLVLLLAACGATPMTTRASVPEPAPSAVAAPRAANVDVVEAQSSAPADTPVVAPQSFDQRELGAPEPGEVGAPPLSLTPLRTAHELPVAGILQSLKQDRHGPSTRILLVGVSDPRLVRALVARGDRIDVFEEDDGRFLAAEQAAHGKLFRCKRMPPQIKYEGDYRHYRAVVPCHDPDNLYGSIIVDCMRPGEESLRCAQQFVDPDRIGLGATMYVAFSVEHHLSVRSPFGSGHVFRTRTGFDLLAVNEWISTNVVDGAERGFGASEFDALPANGPEGTERARGRYYGCLSDKREPRVTWLEKEGLTPLSFTVPVERKPSNMAGLEAISSRAAEWFRSEMLVSADIGPECYALLSFDAKSERITYRTPRPDGRNLTVQAMHDDVRPYQLAQAIGAYSPHVRTATAALERGDVDSAITELELASSVLEVGLGDLAARTLRGFLVRELTNELSWARSHQRVTDYARVVVRFRSYLGLLDKLPVEKALLSAVASFARTSLGATPQTAAIAVALHELDIVANRKLLPTNKWSQGVSWPDPEATHDWLEGRGDYVDYGSDRLKAR